jgi:hypothetical protein
MISTRISMIFSRKLGNRISSKMGLRLVPLHMIQFSVCDVRICAWVIHMFIDRIRVSCFFLLFRYNYIVNVVRSLSFDYGLTTTLFRSAALLNVLVRQCKEY